MNTKLLFSLPVVLFWLQATAQVTPPCPNPPPPGAGSCQTTCVYCDFDGYMGTNDGPPSGGNLVCGQITIHNDQWFGFVAGTSSITINIATSNCVVGDGLQAAFFANCTEDAIECNPGNGGGGGQPLELSYSNFVPGQTYYLMVDGYIGDVCDFEIEVLNGSVTPPTPAAPTPPQGPNHVCPGATAVYSIPDVDGAGYYHWIGPSGSSINGGTNNVTIPAPEGATVTVTFANAGGQLCVQVGNACSPPQQACLTIVNQPIPATILPPIVVCYEDLPFIWDEAPYTTISVPGNVTLSSTPYDSYLGCDSTVKQTIKVKSQIKTNLNTVYVCQGSCFMLNGNSYCQTGGPFQETFESFLGCDSLVQFNVYVVPTLANIQPVQSIDCASPQLVLNSNGSTTGPSVSYTWTNASWNVLGTLSTQNVGSVGTYNLIISNMGGSATCKDTATIAVTGNTTPPGATAAGGNFNCIANTVALQGSSPTSGVNFLWAGPGITPANQNLQNPVVNVSGNYSLTVTNPANSCTSVANAPVNSDVTPPSASAAGGTITCGQSAVTLDGMTNAANASFNWSGPGINAGNQTQEKPNVNAPGSYSLTITNTVNGCTSTTGTTVDQNTAIPSISAGTDQTITCQQLNVTLNGSGNTGAAPIQFTWTGPGITSANQNIANPAVNAAGQYILTVSNPLSACFSKDTVLVDAQVNLPVADAGADATLTCAIQSIALNGGGSDQGPVFSTLWSGPGINPGNQSALNPTVAVSGAYTLTITNTSNGCTSTDNVTVNINTTAPIADAGLNQILTCTAVNGITLNGNSDPANVLYLWSGTGIGTNNDTLQNPVVTQPDTYTLQVTNPLNGCTATDQVVVMQDANVPLANAGPDLLLNCTVTSVNINASGTSSGAGITYQWTGPGISGANINVQSPVNIILPGTYKLTVTDANNNCLNTDIVVIQIDTVPPSITAGPDLVLNCYNNGLDTLDASASSAGPNFVYLWNGPGISVANQNDIRPYVNIDGLYTLMITNTTNTCTATAFTTVSNDLVAPIADAGTDKTIDCVTTSTAIGGNSSTGFEFAYTWTGPGIDSTNLMLANPDIDVPGMYDLVVTNMNNGCTATSAVTVNTNAVFPIADAGADNIITCMLPALNLDGTGSSSGVNMQAFWSGPSITSSNENQVSPSIDLPGTYVLTIINLSNSCASEDTVVVDLNQNLPTADLVPGINLDCQVNSTVLDGSGSSAGLNINYLWTGPDISSANATQVSPSITSPGTYMLLVTDTENGCTSTIQTTVLQNITPPLASAGNDMILTCAQSSLPIDGSGSSVGANFNYVWSGPGINTNNFNQQSPIVSVDGNYTVTVTDTQNHCTASDMVFVGIDNALPITAAGPDQTLTCVKDTIQLDGALSQVGANFQYAWSGPGIVAGQSTLASPGVVEPGQYVLTVTNTTNGCTNSDAVTVNENVFQPLADAGSDPVLTCANSGAGVLLDASASSNGANFSLLWSGPGIMISNQNMVNPNVLVSGTYTVTLTDNNNGCTATDEVTVLQDQNLPTAIAGTDQMITCSFPDVQLDGSGSSTSGGAIQYVWSGPGISGGSQNDPIVSVSTSGTYTLTVINPISGCQAGDMVEVLLDNQPPVLTVTTDIITCADPLGDLSVSSSLSGSTFLWQGPGLNSTLPVLQVGIPGLYSVTATAPNGCTATEMAVMDASTDFPDGSAEGALLDCTNNGLSNITGIVNTPGATFVWNGPNGSFFSNTIDPAVTQTGTYTLVITNSSGCTRAISIDVLADFNAPQVNAMVSDKLDCNTTSLSLNAAGTSSGAIYTYQWTTVDGNIVSGANGLSPVVDEPGNYQLLVSNNINGCRDSASVQVEIDPAVPTSLDVAVQDIRCFGESNGTISILGVQGGMAPFLYALNGGPSTSVSNFTGLAANTYTIALEDANGCKLDSLVTIIEPGQLTVELGPDIEVQLGESATVQAQITNTTPLASVTWNYAPNCDTLGNCYEFNYLPLQSYRHQISLVDSNGCKASDALSVIVKKDRHVFIPNIFNPEGDDPLNALLMIQGGADVKKIRSYQIFDRWGNAVFEVRDFLPNDPLYAWDGSIRGDKGAPAVYVWYAEIEFIDGAVEIFKGDVALFR